jgi:hypothetical protein
MITINSNAADVITIQIGDADQIQLNTTAIALVSSSNADTLNNQNGAYYLTRANHTGSQAIDTVDGLQDALDSKIESVAWGDIAGNLTAQTDLQHALDAKLDSATYHDRFLGLYASVFDLEAAHSTALAGDYAQVDAGIGSDVIIYIWDVSDARWIPVGVSNISSTDDVPEGSGNLYHTSQRVRDTPLAGLSLATSEPITAADSVLNAAGKLQAQISAASGTIDGLQDALADLADADSALAGQIVEIQNALPLKADLVGGVIPASQIPAIAITELLKLPDGEFPASQAEMLTLQGQQGDFTIRTDLSTQYTIISGDGSALADWLPLPQAASPVLSVNSQTGVVVLGRADVGINSSDDVPEGSSNLYHTGQRVRDTSLTDLSLETATPITANDTILSAAGKLQAQINSIAPTAATPKYFAGRTYVVGGRPSPSQVNPPTSEVQFVPAAFAEDITISEIGLRLPTGVTPRPVHFGLYELVESSNPNVLRFVSVGSPVIVTLGNTATDYFATCDYQVKRGKLYFYATLFQLSTSVHAASAAGMFDIGVINNAKVSGFTLSRSYAEGLPTDLFVNTTTVSTAVMPQCRYRIVRN